MARVNGKIIMVMLYKYLFYGLSYCIKKYAQWDVGSQYFIGAAMTMGMTLSAAIISITNITLIIFFPHLLNWRFQIYMPLIISISFTIYMGITKKGDKIYEEIANMEPRRKKRLKILNIVHLIVVWGIFFALGDIIRKINGF